MAVDGEEALRGLSLMTRLLVRRRLYEAGGFISHEWFTL